jgi:hypothetical protein
VTETDREMAGIETANDQMVGAVRRGLGGALVVTVSAPAVAMTPDEGLRHADRLDAVAEHHATHPFADVLEAVKST